MNIDKVWNQGITGKNVIVAVVDDAVDFRHADLKRNYVSRPLLNETCTLLWTLKKTGTTTLGKRHDLLAKPKMAEIKGRLENRRVVCVETKKTLGRKIPKILQKNKVCPDFSVW